MKLNKEFDSITESLAHALKYAEDYGEEEMYEILSILVAFYLGGETKQFHKFFIKIVERYHDQ
tara:strand:- start:2691 stop:2879 length:189 start_codon:yes stop_codon:yes gene_type:complete